MLQINPYPKNKRASEHARAQRLVLSKVSTKKKKKHSLTTLSTVLEHAIRF